MHIRSATVWGLSFVVAAALLTGCSDATVEGSGSGSGSASGSQSSAPTAGEVTAPSGSASADPSAAPTGEDGEPIAPASRRPDPVVSGAPSKVARPGAKPGKVSNAEPAPVSEAVTYDDGLQVRLGKVSRGTVTDQGPGQLTGLEYTVVPVEVLNKTGKTLDLSNVVPELHYGKPARVASPVYVPQTRDLTGSLAPNATATAKYAFAIPAEGLGEVSLWLDIDGAHGLAQFTGSMK